MKQISWLSIFLIIIALGVLAPTLIKNDERQILGNKKAQITIVCGGDVMLGLSVNAKMKQNGSFWPFEKIFPVLSYADISFINLESPFADPCPTTNTGMIFCSDNKNIQGLVDAGIDIVNLANNHMLNYSQKGLQNTANLLAKNNIKFTGVNNYELININGTKFAFVGFNDIGSFPNITSTQENLITDLVSKSKQNADVVIASFHWGNEYTFTPTERQKNLAHLAIDSGADVVIGHHPHWVQPLEKYQGKTIVYSHGNLIFDQMWSTDTRQGVISKFTFEGNKLVSLELIPIKIEYYGQPIVLRGEEGQLVIKKLSN